ncbi:SET domain-containing protein [Aspergillus ruber CBS 135680]|uniref:SET domain-containing protein n=1 Tax=Aspergillus ruber (strain CBS 135680) TaxID=1388766 RepID=A0A017SAI9_ASPRC|nr:uncharacterized protein EURHEDRAFT_414787 [Aspergillus ruber CBS 135680]EYE93210.1 hypothetical protein EURHEDRAFT_414787 [Aspergillus ruber CBS 135680]
MVDFIDVHASGKYGNAAYSTRDLRPGDIILREAPLLVVQPPPNGKGVSFLDSIFNAKNIPASSIEHEIQKLSPVHKAELRKIACEEDTDISRFMSCHYDIRPKQNEAPTAFGLFLKGSYINHSCQPNLLYFWDEKMESMTWVVLKHIVAGQEVNISYLPMFDWQEVNERRALLQNIFPFECNCMLCEKESSNPTVFAHQHKLRDLHMALINIASSQDGNTRSFSLDLQHLVGAYLAAITQELPPGQTLDPRLYRAYYLAASIYSQSGNPEKGVLLGSKATVLVDQLYGKHSPQGQHELEFCKQLYSL